MRSAPLTTIKGGINRLRTKGGARADNLYDLLNGYVTDAGTIKSRPGTAREATLDGLTRGLVAFGDSLHTFCHTSVTVPTGFTLNILAHPDSDPDYEIALEKIHFAAPYLGALYVVAEFEDGAIYHYWLQEPNEWEADTVYANGDLVAPTVANGLVYRATRLGDPYPSWAANVPRADGTGAYEQSVIEPTVYNDYYYVCVSAFGTNPQSGDTEPTWPTSPGAQVTEEAGVSSETSQVPPTPPATNAPTPQIVRRYGRYGTRIVED